MTPAPTETKKILLRAAEILDAGWCTGCYARNQNGYQLSIMQAEAGVDSFCLSGAIMKAVMEYDGGLQSSAMVGVHPLALSAMNAVSPRTGFHISGWNDRVCPSQQAAVDMVRSTAHDIQD